MGGRLLKRRLSKPIDRIASWMDIYGWAILVLLVILTIGLGYIGFTEYYRNHPGPHSVLDRIYYSLQLSALQNRAQAQGGSLPTALLIARFLAPLAAAIGVIGALRALIRALQRGEWKARRAKDHAIVCGLGRKGSVLARGLLKEMDVVAIDRGEFPHLVERCRDEGVTVLTGDAQDVTVLKAARLERAHCLIAICGADVTNASIAITASEFLQSTHRKARIIVHMSDQELGELVQRESPDLACSVISVYHEAAKAMLSDPQAPFPETFTPRQSVLVVGLGDLGRHLVVHAAERWKEKFPGQELRLLILDRSGEEKTRQLQLRREDLNGTWRFETWTKDLTGPEFDLGEYLRPGAKEVGVAYVCLDKEELALTTARRLREHLAKGVPIKVRMSGDSGAPEKPMPGDRFGLAKLMPSDVDIFNWLDLACTPERFGVAPREQ